MFKVVWNVSPTRDRGLDASCITKTRHPA